MIERSRRARRRLVWFERGQEALRKVLPRIAEGYACPICWRVFSQASIDDGTLTFEHAPARSMAGREVALTCKDCNNPAGSKFESQALARERMIDFVQGTLDAPLGATVRSGGLAMNAQVRSIGRSITINGNPKWNPRGTGDAWAQYLGQQVGADAGTSPEWQISFRLQWEERASHLAYLRWAYLVAFAMLGYRYILSPLNRILHLQLVQPDQVHIPVFSVTDPLLDKRTRRVVIVKEPTELESLVIQLGRTAVFLPWQDNNLYEHLRQDSAAATSMSVQIHGDLLVWPTKPVLALDFSGSPR